MTAKIGTAGRTTGSSRTPHAYAWCERFVARRADKDPLAMAVDLPGLRPALCAVYAFMRTTTDIASATTPATRLADALSAWEALLHRAFHGDAHHPIFVALIDVARTYDLPITPLQQLIDAARRELSGTRPATAAEYEQRCEASAAPLARTLLILCGERSPSAIAFGERFAVGLRMLDDLVDLADDAARDRVRLPEADLLAFDLTRRDLLEGRSHPRVAELATVASARAAAFLAYGHPLRRLAPAVLRPVVERLSALGLAVAERLGARADVAPPVGQSASLARAG